MIERKRLSVWCHGLAVMMLLATGSAPSVAQDASLEEMLRKIFSSSSYQITDQALHLEGEAASGNLVAVGSVELVQGGTRAAGDQLLPGDQVCKGVLMNKGKDSLAVKRGDGTLLNVAASELVVLDDCEPAPSGCSISCDEGTFACCNYDGPFCRCVDAFYAECDSGGHDASSCSVTVTPVCPE